MLHPFFRTSKGWGWGAEQQCAFDALDMESSMFVEQARVAALHPREPHDLSAPEGPVRLTL